MRCTEIEEFCRKLTTFTQDIIEIVNLYSSDNAENLITLKKSFNLPQSNPSTMQLYKARCKILISTPNNTLNLFKKEGFKNMQCTSLIVDKIDMHIALDLSSELQALAQYNIEPSFKTIITTNFKDDQKDDENF